MDFIIKEYQIIYTDTAMSHRFLRFTLPFGASLVPLNNLLKNWNTDPLANFSIQIDSDIQDPKGKLLSKGFTQTRQFVTVRLVTDLIGHVGLEQESSDEDAIRQSERPEVKEEIMNRCQEHYGQDRVGTISIGTIVKFSGVNRSTLEKFEKKETIEWVYTVLKEVQEIQDVSVVELRPIKYLI